MLILYPHYSFHRIYDIPSEFFRDRGITTLLLDVDNTLTSDNHPEPDAQVTAWLSRQQEAGLRLMILSNNYTRRVAPFAQKLGLEYIAEAAKPLPMNLKKALVGMEVELGEAAIIGDQIFTDILCGRLCGCTAILVEPMSDEKHWFFRLKRWVELPVIKSYRRWKEKQL